MKQLTKINILLASVLSIGTFIYFKQNPEFKLFKRNTSNLKVGIHQGHAYIKEVNGKSKYLPILNKEKDLEIIWSTDHQYLYLLRRNIKGINQIYLVNPITREIKQKTLPLRPKSHLQAISEQRVSFQSGNEILIFSFKTNKMESILPPLFIDQSSESRHNIYAFYHQLEGQLLNYKIDPELKKIQFKWKDLSNHISYYIQELIVLNNIISLPKKNSNKLYTNASMNIFERLVERAKECESYGFYWTDSNQIFNQISNECEEIKEALNGPKEHLQEEIGDLIDAVIQLCIYLNFNPEEILVNSANKFDKRYNHLKELAKKEGFTTLKNEPMSKLLQLWKQAKLMK